MSTPLDLLVFGLVGLLLFALLGITVAVLVTAVRSTAADARVKVLQAETRLAEARNRLTI